MAARRIVLCVEYDGRAFKGWQTQPGGGTVQDTLEAALERIAGAPVATVCAGRTDSGVHATAQVLHFDIDASRPLSAWTRGVNSGLPSAIAVRWAREVDGEFHARFSALQRHYRYVLLNRPERPGLLAGRVGWYHRPLELARMRSAAEHLLGTHDFSAFRAAACQARNPVRDLQVLRIERCGDFIGFDFSANGFLHHMVRNLVGTLVQVGSGRQAVEWVGEVLASKNRALAAPTFSPEGLYLCGVSYPARWSLPDEGRIISRPVIAQA